MPLTDEKKKGLFASFFDLIKPEAEKLVEGNLDKFLEIPVIREAFNVSPKLMVSLLSLGIGMIPEESRNHPLMRFVVDMLETMPREISRILEADVGGAKVADTHNPATAAASVVKAKKGGKVSPAVLTPAPGSILNLLDKKLIGVPGGLTGFLEWFLKLAPDDQKKVEAHVLSLELERIEVFMSIRPEERMWLVSKLSPPPPEVEAITVPERFSAVFASMVVEHLKAKSKHPKKYGTFARSMYRLSGNPIDKQGRRK